MSDPRKSRPLGEAGDTDELVERLEIEVRIGAAVRYANRIIRPVTDQPIASSCEGAAAAIVLDALEATGYSIVPLSALTSLRAERDAANADANEIVEVWRRMESSLAAEKQLGEQAEEAIATQNGVIVSLGQRVVELERRLEAGTSNLEFVANKLAAAEQRVVELTAALKDSCDEEREQRWEGHDPAIDLDAAIAKSVAAVLATEA